MRRIFLLGIVLLTSAAVGACQSKSAVTSPEGARPGEIKTLMDITTGIEVTSGGTGTWNYAGQSFTVGETGSYTNVRFHWYTFQRTPVAFGALTLLTQEYLGLPRDLGPATPGFVARSERVVENVYYFGETITITGGTKYWVYSDAQGSFAGSFDQDIYMGGDMYVTGIQSQPFRRSQASGRMVNGVFVPAPPGVFVDANFKLQASVK
jgi:hypothetical protein